MKIICEYCKNSIDTDKDSQCPNCRASYSDNKMFIERIEKLKEEKDLELETKKMQNEMTKNILETSKKIKKTQSFILIPLIIFIFVFVVALNQIKRINNFDFKESSRTNKITTTTTPTEKSITVNKNEYGETNSYRVMVDKVVKIDKLYGVLSPTEGKKYLVFHIIVENKQNSTLILNQKVNCIVDGFSQNESYYISKYPDLPFRVDGNLKVEGYKIFEVPKDAKTYDIKYGDYVTIHIEE